MDWNQAISFLWAGGVYMTPCTWYARGHAWLTEDDGRFTSQIRITNNFLAFFYRDYSNHFLVILII